MKLIVSGREAVSQEEFTELAMGVVPELFAGVPGETADERAARLDAAHDILADLWREDPDAAAFAARLMDAPMVETTSAVDDVNVGRWAA